MKPPVSGRSRKLFARPSSSLANCETWLFHIFSMPSAWTEWDAVTSRLQVLLLFMVRMVWVGFLVLFLLLTALPVYLAWNPDQFAGLFVYGIGATYCVGLGVLTRRLHRETGAATPWKESFVAAGVLTPAALVSALAR